MVQKEEIENSIVKANLVLCCWGSVSLLSLVIAAFAGAVCVSALVSLVWSGLVCES